MEWHCSYLFMYHPADEFSVPPELNPSKEKKVMTLEFIHYLQKQDRNACTIYE